MNETCACSGDSGFLKEVCVHACVHRSGASACCHLWRRTGLLLSSQRLVNTHMHVHTHKPHDCSWISYPYFIPNLNLVLILNKGTPQWLLCLSPREQKSPWIQKGTACSPCCHLASDKKKYLQLCKLTSEHEETESLVLHQDWNECWVFNPERVSLSKHDKTWTCLFL